MARGRPVVVCRVASVLACLAAGPHIAFGQSGNNQLGFNLGIPGISLLNLVTTTSGAVSLNREGLSASLPGISSGSLITTTQVSANLSHSNMTATLPAVSAAGGTAITTQASVTVSSGILSATLPGTNVAGLITTRPTLANVSSTGASVALPAATLAGTTVSTPSLNVNLSGQGPLIEASGVNVTVGNQPAPTLPLGGVLQQVSQAQLFAGIGSAEVFVPIEQMLNGLAPGKTPCASTDASAFGPVPASDIWTWNASTVTRTDHDGYRVSAGDSAECRSTLPFQTQERASLPGILWDASSAFGLKKGTLHLGLTAGAAEADTRVRPNAMLRDSGVTQAASARLRSVSVGAFALLTANKWYSGTAVGAAWGNTESQNFVAGSASDYDMSSVVAAGFVGTIIPVSDVMRFDVRGTLSYQRTVGDAHLDTAGVAYGDHTIEGADAILSARLFGVISDAGSTFRPFLQAGLTQRLVYSNLLAIDGVTFRLEEADTSSFAAAGLDFEIDNALQLSVGIRHDHNADYETWTGRFGFVMRFY